MNHDELTVDPSSRVAVVVGGSQSNWPSMPDSLDYINHQLVASTAGVRSDDKNQHECLMKQQQQSSQIPSIVIGSNGGSSNEDNNNNKNTISNSPGQPVWTRRKERKRATSLLVRFSDEENEDFGDDSKPRVSKLDQIRMKIYNNSHGSTDKSESSSPKRNNSDKVNSNGSVKILDKTRAKTKAAVSSPIPIRKVAGSMTTILRSFGRRSRDNSESQTTAECGETPPSLSNQMPAAAMITTTRTFDVCETPPLSLFRDAKTVTSDNTNKQQFIRSITRPFRRQANK